LSSQKASPPPPSSLPNPTGAPAAKVEAIKAYGADVVFCANSQTARETTCASIAAATGAAIIPVPPPPPFRDRSSSPQPFDHPDVIAGQGTMALEIFDQDPSVDAVVTAISGGGFTGGVAMATKRGPSCTPTNAADVKPTAQVFAAEPEGANDTFLSLQQGGRVKIAAPATIADGLRVPVLGELTWPIIRLV
jgi:threonine dehydratase